MKYAPFLVLIQTGSAQSVDGFEVDLDQSNRSLRRCKAHRRGDAARETQSERLKPARKGV
jgi:hypothetical protein